MSQAAYAGLIEGFGKAIGLAGATPDADGYCAMSFDDLVVHFQYDEGEVTIFARIGEADEDRLEGIYAMLLAANMFWQGTKGATFSVEPDSNIVFIAARKPVAGLADAAFQAWVGEFVQIADHWQAQVKSANEGGPLWGEDGADNQSGDTSSMMRV